MSPSSTYASLNASAIGRSPEGTAMLAALSLEHIAQRGPAWGGPALGPKLGGAMEAMR